MLYLHCIYLIDYVAIPINIQDWVRQDMFFNLLSYDIMSGSDVHIKVLYLSTKLYSFYERNEISK